MASLLGSMTKKKAYMLIALLLALIIITVVLLPPPPPVVSLSITPASGTTDTTFTGTWTSTDTDSCTIEGGGEYAANDSVAGSGFPLGVNTYVLTCTGRGGSTSVTASFTVTE